MDVGYLDLHIFNDLCDQLLNKSVLLFKFRVLCKTQELLLYLHYIRHKCIM